jgi:hypothetical protein
MDSMGIISLSQVVENCDSNRCRLANCDDERGMQAVAETANYPAGV